jgi:hypothetical protein
MLSAYHQVNEAAWRNRQQRVNVRGQPTGQGYEGIGHQGEDVGVPLERYAADSGPLAAAVPVLGQRHDGLGIQDDAPVLVDASICVKGVWSISE